MSKPTIRHRFQSIAEQLTHFKVERMVVVDLSYETYDHAYLQACLNIIGRSNVRENRNMSKHFTYNYLKGLKKHALVMVDDKNEIRLTALGQSIQKYVTNMNELVSEARQVGFSNDNLYRCLKSVSSLGGKTLSHLEDIGFVENKRLTNKGQSVFDFLETQEIAKWKRAGKPECAPVAF